MNGGSDFGHPSVKLQDRDARQSGEGVLNEKNWVGVEPPEKEQSTCQPLFPMRSPYLLAFSPSIALKESIPLRSEVLCLIFHCNSSFSNDKRFFSLSSRSTV